MLDAEGAETLVSYLPHKFIRISKYAHCPISRARTTAELSDNSTTYTFSRQPFSLGLPRRDSKEAVGCAYQCSERRVSLPLSHPQPERRKAAEGWTRRKENSYEIENVMMAPVMVTSIKISYVWIFYAAHIYERKVSLSTLGGAAQFEDISSG